MPDFPRSLGTQLVTTPLVLSGCSPMNPGLITGVNQTVVAVDLNSATQIGAITLPDAAATAEGLQAPVIAVRGTRAFLTGSDHKTYILNISASGLEFNATSPLSLPDNGEVLDSASANPWMLVGSSAPTLGRDLGVNNTLDLTIEVSSINFWNRFAQAIVCDDGETVLVRSTHDDEVRLLNLDRGGQLTDTGHVLSVAREPEWIACAPGAEAGAVLLAGGEPAGGVLAFKIDRRRGLSAGTRINPHAHAVGADGPISNSIAFAADARGLFVRSSGIIGGEQDGWLERFSFDPSTATIGDSPEFTVRAGVSFRGGRNQVGVNPEGGDVYVPNASYPGGRVEIFDAATGARRGSIEHPDMPAPVEFIIAK